MKIIKHYLFALSIAAILLSEQIVGNEAFVIVPGIDCVGAPLAHGFNPADLPYQENGSIYGSRLHQLLFNEPVTIIKKVDNYACVRSNSAYYATAQKQLKNEYWIVDSALETVENLSSKNTLAAFPTENTQTVMLLSSWLNPTTHLVHYAGTRFALAPKQLDKDFYHCLLYDASGKSVITVAIERSLCRRETPVMHTQARKLFLALLKKYAHTQPAIPYIWGGSGFKGFDCAGLIYRTARTAGIPLILKNSSALAHYLEPVTTRNQLQNGDIIWLPGHVLVISDIAKNSIIEARCYSHGYGKIHEASLSELFSGITTFDDLWQLYANKKPLIRLAKDGSKLATIPTFKLLQLESAWHVCQPQ